MPCKPGKAQPLGLGVDRHHIDIRARFQRRVEPACRRRFGPPFIRIQKSVQFSVDEVPERIGFAHDRRLRSQRIGREVHAREHSRGFGQS